MEAVQQMVGRDGPKMCEGGSLHFESLWVKEFPPLGML